MQISAGKIFLYIFLIAWLSTSVWIGFNIYIGAPKQIEKDNAFVVNEIYPNIKTIDSFKLVNHRLPSVIEFNNIKHGTSGSLGNTDYIRENKYVDNEVKDLVKGVSWNDNYVLEVWRGEWMEYYISSGRKFITNNCTLKDGILGFMVCLLIGIIPSFVYLAIVKRTKNKNRNNESLNL